MQSKHYTSTDQKTPLLDHGSQTGQNFNRQNRASNTTTTDTAQLENLQIEVCILNKNLKQHTELFQAGKTKSCLPIWRSLTSDHEISATVSGLSIELEGETLLESRTHNCSQAQQEIIDIEIQKLLKKKVIVKSDHKEGEIISPTFLKEKPDGSF